MTRNDQGVSVIVGTLLLILITVTAAAALALMVSQMQKAEMTRQSQIQAVKDEDIMISGMKLANTVNWNATYPNPPFNVPGSRNWSSISFNLMNMNTQDVAIEGIAINNYYAYPLNFTSLSLSTPRGSCNLSVGGGGCQVQGSDSATPYLTIPAGKSVQVTFNLTESLVSPVPPFVGTGDQIDIKILTSLTNIFEQTYRLPTPVISYNTETSSLGTVQRDSIVLDGSQSSSTNATIVSWTWALTNAASTWPAPGNCSDTNNLVPVSGLTPTFSGRTIHISPPLAGPFCANLTVTDSNGMVATTSPDQVIPADTAFTPAANLIATFNTTYSPPVINVTIRDINGNPVSNAAVNYILDTNQFGNLSLSNYIGTTNSLGMTSANVTCGTGTVKIVSGQVQPITVAVSANSGC